MTNQYAVFVVFFCLIVTNSSHALHQCRSHRDCGVLQYCLTAYCEQCIPCEKMFNRKPLRSVSGEPICAKHEEDCGGCLPGYQAEDLANQRRTMQCFPLEERDLPASVFVVLLGVLAMLSVSALTLVVTVRKCKLTKLASQETELSAERDVDLFTGDEANGFIRTSEAIVHQSQRDCNLDQPPTYDEAVNNVQLVAEANVKKYFSGTDRKRKENDRVFNAKSNVSAKSLMQNADATVVPSLWNQSMEAPLHFGIGDEECDSSSVTESAGPSSKIQLDDAGILQLDQLEFYSINAKSTFNQQKASMISRKSVNGQTDHLVLPSPSTSLALGSVKIEGATGTAPSATNSTLKSDQLSYFEGTNNSALPQLGNSSEF